MAAVPPVADSELSLARLALEASASTSAGDPLTDTLVFALEGSATLELDGSSHDLGPGCAAILLAGEEAVVAAGGDGANLVHISVGTGVDVHAPLGARTGIARAATALSERATGKRSADVLLGPHNGCVRATLFVGHIPPGRAPWHYHLYDEIVWILSGRGRLHLDEGRSELRPGDAFRLRPRQLHIVENLSERDELVVLGVFTPAGSPTAAYLPAGSPPGER